MTVPVASPPPLDRGRDTHLAEITRALLAYLLAGDLRPGDRVPPERKLAQALGVGRSAVREALKALSLLGLIEIRPGNGTFLRPSESDLLPDSIQWGLLLGEQQIDDFGEARQELEVILAGLGAMRRTDRDLAAIRASLREMRASREDPDPAKRASRFGDADVAFHAGVWSAGKNATLEQVMSSIRSLLEVWIRRVIRAEADTRALYEDHAGVFSAIERQDEDAARRAMKEHMAHSAARLRAILSVDRSHPAESGAPTDGAETREEIGHETVPPASDGTSATKRLRRASIGPE